MPSFFTFRLLRASFIPPLPQRDLRDLTRPAHNLVRDLARLSSLAECWRWASLA